MATIYHYFFGLQAPYAYTSLPVILGTLGGLGLVIGPIGLLYLNIKRDPMHGEPYRVCRRPTFLRECPNDKTKIYP